ncbi:hypothetical protein QW180_25105 [Vibrio sinaloensis]|nr:hypothetical protein [Vibrio sinaloensis]
MGGQVEASIPVGLLGASGCEIEPEKLLFFGGYNKSTFDDFLSKLSQVDAALKTSTTPSSVERIYVSANRRIRLEW